VSEKARWVVVALGRHGIRTPGHVLQRGHARNGGCASGESIELSAGGQDFRRAAMQG
jgi:hypothetical protein